MGKLSQAGKNIEIVLPEENRDNKRFFADGEIYAKISRAGKLRRSKTVVLHSGSPLPNEGLVELELILQILRDSGVSPDVFFSYFPYGLQDKVFEKGETNAAENLIEKLINYYKVEKIYAIDPHFQGRKWAKKYPITALSAVPYLMEEVRRDLGENTLFLSADKGGRRRTGFPGTQKERFNSYNIKMSLSPKINLKGKTIGIVDDLIKSGNTLINFCDIAKKSGAEKVAALITHGVIKEGIARVKRKYEKLYLTNTIHQESSNVDISELILKAISR